MANATLKVTGMTCGHCVNTVRTALESAGGVAAAEVDLEKGLAEVEYDASRTTPRALAGVVSDEGYMAEELPG